MGTQISLDLDLTHNKYESFCHVLPIYDEGHLTEPTFCADSDSVLIKYESMLDTPWQNGSMFCSVVECDLLPLMRARITGIVLLQYDTRT